MKNKMDSMLELVRTERTCPPSEILLEQRDTARVQEHLKECGFCRDLLKELLGRDDEEWQSFAGALANELEASPPAFEESRPVRGEVRGLRSGLVDDTFAGGRWHAAPLVLVIDDCTGRDGEVLVAQVSDQSLFVDRGDVFLDENELWFAQAWNVWAMPARDLGPALSTADDGVAAEVLELSRAEDLAPVRDLAGGFREIERAVGEFYASVCEARLRELAAERDSVHVPGLFSSLQGALAAAAERLLSFFPPIGEMLPCRADAAVVHCLQEDRDMLDERRGEAVKARVGLFFCDEEERLEFGGEREAEFRFGLDEGRVLFHVLVDVLEGESVVGASVRLAPGEALRPMRTVKELEGTVSLIIPENLPSRPSLTEAQVVLCLSKVR